jgi:NAD(P)-dependent dehydrogenase (short-subunit alcohol dehydrogenase family)
VSEGVAITPVHIALNDEATIAAAAEQIKSDGPLDMVLVATGMLTDQASGIAPEKTFRHQSAEAFAAIFAVNTFGPALVAKHFLPLLARKQRVVFAALSARVGSISDNRLGGWHAYRASKAALNMLIKNYALEMVRRNDQAVIVGLHPGTVATDLSADFTSSAGRTVFSADQSATYLLDVLAGLSAKDSGKVFDWAGKEIPA